MHENAQKFPWGAMTVTLIVIASLLATIFLLGGVNPEVH